MENKMSFKEDKQQLEVIFEGEIDHQTTLVYRQRLISKLEHTHYNEVIFNFENVSFIDSSGIGMVLGRYNQLTKQNSTLYFSGLSEPTKRLFELSGLLKLIEIKEVIRHG